MRKAASRETLDCLSGRRLAAVSRLAGGRKKGACRLTFDDGFIAADWSWMPRFRGQPKTGKCRST